MQFVHRASVYSWGASHYGAWLGLHNMITTGEVAFQHTEGKSLWDFYNQPEHTEDLSNFQG